MRVLAVTWIGCCARKHPRQVSQGPSVPGLQRCFYLACNIKVVHVIEVLQQLAPYRFTTRVLQKSIVTEQQHQASSTHILELGHSGHVQKRYPT